MTTFWIRTLALGDDSLEMGAYKLLRIKYFHGVSSALHQKSGQKSDPQVNKDFLVSL